MRGLPVNAGEEKMILDNATKGIYGGKVDTLYEKQLSVEIGSFKTSIPVLFSANNKALLGNEFLKHFDVYVDYEEDVISLVVRKDVLVNKMAPLVAGILNDSTWIVNRTIPAFPLQLGDSLASINGKKPIDLFKNNCEYFFGIGEILNTQNIEIIDTNGKTILLKND